MILVGAADAPQLESPESVRLVERRPDCHPECRGPDHVRCRYKERYEGTYLNFLFGLMEHLCGLLKFPNTGTRFPPVIMTV
jgi:hypothetical protein